MKFWITADWHLGEDRFEIMQRPGFRDAQDMVGELVFNHNELVEPEDLVYVVGDACNQKTPEFLEQVDRFNGVKILIRGNHDRVFTDEQLLKYFKKVIPEGEGMELKVGPDQLLCWATHYPTQAKGDRFNLVGHIHAAWKFQLNAVNIGVDCNHYRPHNLDEAIPFFYKAICEFYDQDVWAAYHPSQDQFHTKRGKPGRYLDEA